MKIVSTRDDYLFMGLFTEQNSGSLVMSESAADMSRTLYVHRTRMSYAKVCLCDVQNYTAEE